MALKFGTSGVRGLVDDLTNEEVFLLTTAFLRYADSINQGAPVAVAEDLRESSPKIQEAVCRAVHSYGQKAFLCGKIPTPALAYFAQERKNLAIMITGSHIPADRNGIKFYLQTGETLKKDDQSIYDIYLQSKKQDHIDVSSEATQFFSQRYLDFFPAKSLSQTKVIVYQHSSVARDILPAILENLGAQVLRLGKSQNFIPVDTEAVESVKMLADWVHEYQADALVSTDGDGDRPLIVDNGGQVISGDKIGIITSLFLKIQAVALPISCNSCITQMNEFKKVSLTKIGSPYVVEALNDLSQDYSLVAGFEANGGYILQSSSGNLRRLPTRDSILPILCTLIAAKKNGISLSELVQKLPSRFTKSILFRNCPLEKSQHLLQMIEEDPSLFLSRINPQLESKVINVNKLDGIRLTLKNADIVHFRPSGNAPELRCYIESQTQERSDRLAEIIQKSIEKVLILQ